MTTYPSREAAMQNTATGMWTVNVGGGTFTQDTAGTATNINAVTGAWQTNNATADVRNMRRDVIGPIAVRDDTLTHQLFEGYQYFGASPWPGTYGNGLLVGFLFFVGGTADGNLQWGLGAYSPAAFPARDYLWTTDGTGAITMADFNTNTTLNAKGWRCGTWWHKATMRQSVMYPLDTQRSLKIAIALADAPTSLTFAAGDLYIGTVVGLATAGGPFSYTMQSRFIVRAPPLAAP